MNKFPNYINTLVDMELLSHHGWLELSSNPEDIYMISRDDNKNRMEFKLRRLNWPLLSLNPIEAAIELLEKHPDKIDWNMASFNSGAIHLLEQNPDKVNWRNVSINSSAIPLLEKNLNKIDYDMLILNPSPLSQQLLELLNEYNKNKITHNTKLVEQFNDLAYA